MPDAPDKILVVEPDPDVVEILVAALSRRFDAQITCVGSADHCLDTDMIEPHDLVIAEMDLPDSEGAALAEQLIALRVRPIILLAYEPTLEDAIEAMRLGVRDLLCKPFGVNALLDAAAGALRGQQLHRQHGTKYRQMRELVRRVIRERRDLNRRVELICRDLVGAQRRLAHRVLEVDKKHAKSKT